MQIRPSGNDPKQGLDSAKSSKTRGTRPDNSTSPGGRPGAPIAGEDRITISDEGLRLLESAPAAEAQGVEEGSTLTAARRREILDRIGSGAYDQDPHRRELLSQLAVTLGLTGSPPEPK